MPFPLRIVIASRETLCPEFKGIKTIASPVGLGRGREKLSALNSKGLRPLAAAVGLPVAEKLSALNSKGLRHSRYGLLDAHAEKLSALNSKGLRPEIVVAIDANVRETLCPEFKGIKTCLFL